MKSPREHFVSARFAMPVLLGVVSIVIWMLPGLLGAPSSFDSIVVAVWLVGMVLLLVDSRRRERRRKRYMRTFYIEVEGHRVFSPSTGIFSYECGCDLLDAIVVSLAESRSTADLEPPEDFAPSLVLETTVFACVRDEHLHSGDRLMADDVTVTRWEGRLVDLDSGRGRSFSSPFDLEDMFCPGGTGGSHAKTSSSSPLKRDYACMAR